MVFMKMKLPLMVMALMTGGVLSAQVVFQASHLPQADEWLVMALDHVVSGADAGEAGAQVRWDLSMLQSDQIDSIRVMAPSATIAADLFADATLAMAHSGGSYEFLDLDQAMWYDRGFLGPDPTELFDTMRAVRYEDPLARLPLPAVAGTPFEDEGHYALHYPGDGVFFDSLVFTSAMWVGGEVDGWGIVQTPMGYYEAVRCRRAVSAIDSFVVNFNDVWFLADVQVASATTYEWYAPAARGVVAALTWHADGTVAGAYSLLAPPPIAAFGAEEVTPGTWRFTDSTLNAVTSYLWDFGDGQTSTAANPEHHYQTTGDFEVCLIAANDAGSDTTCRTVSVLVTATDEATTDAAVRLYPNPATDYVELTLAGAGAYELALTDESGRVVKRATVHSGSRLNVRDLAAGAYFYTLATPDGKRQVAQGRLTVVH